MVNNMSLEVESAIVNNKRAFSFKSNEQFLSFIENKKCILIALNAEKLNKSDEEINEIINNNVGYPDGIGTVLALKRKGVNSIKIAGAEFWLDIIRRFEKDKSFYLIGATSEVIEQTVNKLNVDFPNINIVGYRNGYLESGDKEALIADFKLKRPDVVFVAMGSPKQEYLMTEFKKAYPALYMGLGGSFDVYTGSVKRAPLLFRKLGAEWLFRLLKEPTRWRRQLALGSFLYKIVLNKI